VITPIQLDFARDHAFPFPGIFWLPRLSFISKHYHTKAIDFLQVMNVMQKEKFNTVRTTPLQHRPFNYLLDENDALCVDFVYTY
jgi:hypothetical protein